MDTSQGVMYSRLGELLDALKASERAKPASERRQVPTLQELADLVGVHVNSLSSYANSHTIRYNLHIGGKIMRILRQRGFDVGINDMIGYREEKADAEKQIAPAELAA